jgi:hypothetical protein
MATVQIIRNVLECDGCKAIFAAPMGHISPMEARAAAYADGWRFPNLVNKHGETTNQTSDACPECIPTWEPRERTTRQRQATQAEVRRWSS